ncbi:MAG: type VI secretion system ATPase TssH [Gemmataceae bacterium]
MPVTNLKALAGKLNAPCRRALEAAAGLCMSRTNYNVEVEHWLAKLLEAADGDLTRLLRHYEIDTTRVNRELTKSLDSLKTGNSRAPELSPDLPDLMREAWSFASVEYGAGQVRSGHLLLALLSDRNLLARLRSSSPELAKVPVDRLLKEMPPLIAGSAEEEQTAHSAPGQPAAAGGPAKPGGGKTPNLDSYTQDLTDRAKKGQIDPVIGRDFEINQVIDILTRRRQNNPILTGEAGVGKTAVAEGFALRIVAGQVPDSMKTVRLLTLDLSLLQAGAGVKGEFENRLKGVIQEVKSSPIPIILFIDEAHTLIGAGGQAGQGDAANLLKPALARGELRTIAATTWAEYKKYFEEDAALKRRFQVVRVGEPDIANAVRMMRGLTAMLEKHHKVRILEEAVEDSVKLSARYITDRQLPDKSISLLDTACARVALSQVTSPPALEDAKREITFADIEMGILSREQAVGAEHAKRMAEVQERKAAAEVKLAALEKQLKEETELVGKVRDARGKLEAHLLAEGKPDLAKDRLSADAEAKLKAELAVHAEGLKKAQGDHPLIQPVVNSGAVAEIVSSWTGIPLGKMVLNEMKTVLALKDHLKARVIGQDHALEAIAQRIQTSRASLSDPGRPMGVFMLVGPSGVGKTETAIALSDILYGGDRNMVVINMSEYKESAKVSQLIGASAGYVGYGKGGVLTEAVRRKPYSVVLLDEIEKAHVDVQELFYQVFDKGRLQDSSGNEVDFKNTIILLTSNAGTDALVKLCSDPDTMPLPEGLTQAMQPALLEVFKPAFLGRCSIVPYYPLADDVLYQIIKLKLKGVGRRATENHKAEFGYDEKVVESVAGRCKEVRETGARNVDHILNGTLLPELAKEVLGRMSDGRPIAKIHIGVGEDGGFTYAVT